MQERTNLVDNIIELFLKKEKERTTVAILPTAPTYRDKVSPGLWAEFTNIFTGSLDKRKRIIKGIINENKDLNDIESRILRERLKLK